MTEIIVDNFAGGGGASTGISQAIGRSVDIAINHDKIAIQMHKRNHPDTKHYIEDVWAIDPIEACAGRPVGLAWFSPDCTHHSKARGGKPRDKNIRGLSWLATKWALLVKPRVIMLENVEEIQTWGPLLANGKPSKKKKGKTWKAFIQSLEELGYKVEWQLLRACDYGAPTTRKRLFLIARCDGKPIIWPEPSHANPKDPRVVKEQMKPWPAAAEIIDWSLPCPSIFNRKKPLVEKTMIRIAKGLKKFVLDADTPFIISIDNQNGTGVNDIQTPLTTITTKARHCIVSPHIVKFRGDSSGTDIQHPLPTITSGAGSVRPAGNAHAMGLCAAFVARHFGQSVGTTLESPLGTQTAKTKDSMIVSFLSKAYGGGYTGSGTNVEAPVDTITTIDHNHLCTTHLIKFKGDNYGSPITEPVQTICAGGTHIGEIRAFLLKYYGTSANGQSIDTPLDTITTKDRFGIVMIENQPYEIVDIGLRMLAAHELYAAQGFPEDYNISGMTKTQQVAKCGNSVSPAIPKALVKANLPELCNTNTKIAA
ncbi:MAG: DNA cytosine methyltransferase [Patescibacteria group bacterium]|jgi:DNA (cytosine-5)-methyltransferase 1